MRVLRVVSVLGALLTWSCTRDQKPAQGSAAVDAGSVTVAAKLPTAAWVLGRPEKDPAGLTPTPGGTLVVRQPIEPLGLTRFHDNFAEGTMVRYTTGTVYETLGRVNPSDPTGPLEPWLAKSWLLSDDHKTLTIQLRDGVTFHDGSMLTSKDFKAVLDVILSKANKTETMRNRFSTLASIETPKPLVLIVKWKEPYFLSQRDLLGAIPAIPASALRGPFDQLAIHRAPIGTGPFRFERWDTGNELTFTRNETYWGDKALLSQLVFRFVKDGAAAVQRWERGEFDVMTRIPANVWRAIEPPAPENAWVQTGYRRIAFPDSTYGWVGWNEQRPFFADARVRRALAMLYPAASIAHSLELGLEVRVTCPYYLSPHSCDRSIVPLPNDIMAAERLLKEAGWVDADGDGVREKDGVPFKFSFLLAAGSARAEKMLPLFQEALTRAGVRAEIERIDPAVMLTRVRARDFDATTMAWSSLDGVNDAYDLFHSSQAGKGLNYVSLADPKLDEVLDQIRRTTDEEARHALERTAHQLIFELQPYLFLTLRPTLDAVKNDVRGLTPSLAGYDYAKVWRERQQPGQ